MPQRRSRSFAGPRQGRSQRVTQWGAGPDEVGYTTLAAGGVDFMASGNAAFLAARPFTIIRVRGVLSINSDQVVASEEPMGAIGMAVVSDEAVAAGLGSLPTPIGSEASDKWFVWQAMMAPFSLSAVGSSSQGGEYIIDSRAMRKVNDGEDLIVMAENASSVHGLDYLFLFRFLIKLH